MNFLALSILNSGVPLSMVCAVIGLAFAFFLIAAVIRAPSGNERMREISAAVQEGATAYLKRQYRTIAIVSIVRVGCRVSAPTGMASGSITMSSTLILYFSVATWISLRVSSTRRAG